MKTDKIVRITTKGGRFAVVTYLTNPLPSQLLDAIEAAGEGCEISVHCRMEDARAATYKMAGDLS